MGFFLVAVFVFFMFLCFKVVHEVVITIRVIFTELCKGSYQWVTVTQPMFTELWRAFITFANVIHGALSKIWWNCTCDNLSSLIAIGIILYTFPEVHSILMELLSKNVVLWASGLKIKANTHDPWIPRHHCCTDIASVMLSLIMRVNDSMMRSHSSLVAQFFW
jgi:hypothetical protein